MASSATFWGILLRAVSGCFYNNAGLRNSCCAPPGRRIQPSDVRFRVVLAHPELVDAFRSVPHRSLVDKVLTGCGGKPLSPRSAPRWIAEGIAKAGLQAAATGTGKGPGSHSLRHSCARHWLQSGLNVNAVSAWLGHSSPTVTLDTYLVLALDTPLGDISEVT